MLMFALVESQKRINADVVNSYPMYDQEVMALAEELLFDESSDESSFDISQPNPYAAPRSDQFQEDPLDEEIINFHKAGKAITKPPPPPPKKKKKKKKKKPLTLTDKQRIKEQKDREWAIANLQ